MNKIQFKPTAEEIKELNNIRNLLICNDKESIKLGKACFFRSKYFKRIKHKNLRVKCFGFFDTDPFKELTRKIDTNDLIALLNYVLNISPDYSWERTANNINCYGLYYVKKML